MFDFHGTSFDVVRMDEKLVGFLGEIT